MSKHAKMNEDGLFTQEYVDPYFGKCQLMFTTEFFHDRIFYETMIDTIKTGPFRDEEVKEWHEAIKQLDEMDWEEVYTRLRILYDKSPHKDYSEEYNPFDDDPFYDGHSCSDPTCYVCEGKRFNHSCR